MGRVKRFPKSVVLILSCLLLSSCFKDVDLSEAKNIALEPDIRIDLLYFKLNENDFLDSQTDEYTPIIRDTVRLEFLDDDYIQDGLNYSEFRFRSENHFPYPVKNTIKFLGENSRTQFRVDYLIPAGTEEDPGLVDTLVIKHGENIGQVKRSIQMMVQLEILGGSNKLNGELDFQSRGLFKFEF